MTIDEQIGLKIYNKRKELKMSQSALAFLAKISRQYLYEIEKGRKSITVSTLDRIRVALKVNFSYFFSGSEANS